MSACNKENDAAVVPYNRNLSFAFGITLAVCMVGELACAICESTAVGKLTSAGAAYGFAFFNISAMGNAFGGWRCPSVKCLKRVFWSSLICFIIAVLFFIGQVVRIIFIVGHESDRDGVTVDNVDAAAALLYTELMLLFVINLCDFALCVLSHHCMTQGAKCSQQPQNGQANAQPMQTY